MVKRLKQIEELFPIVTDRADDKAGSLSGGQQRLVEFARCLMLDPKLVVLDEPSMGLDPKTLRNVLTQIRAMWQDGRTILLVEQNVRAGLSMATHAVVVESGHVRLQGSGAEVWTTRRSPSCTWVPTVRQASVPPVTAASTRPERIMCSAWAMAWLADDRRCRPRRPGR